MNFRKNILTQLLSGLVLFCNVTLAKDNSKAVVSKNTTHLKISSNTSKGHDSSTSKCLSDKKKGIKLGGKFYPYSWIRLYPKELERLAAIEHINLEQFSTNFDFNGIDFNFVIIPGGREYTMGSPETEEGRFKNEVMQTIWIDTFHLQQTPVTQEQWVAVMGNNPSHFSKPQHCQNTHKISEAEVEMCPHFPVENVSYNEVQVFIAKLNRYLRRRSLHVVGLPSEKQWEYAARAGTQTRFPWGDDESRLGEFVWSAYNSEERTHSVGMLQANAFELYDMLGNVAEWTCSYWKGGTTYLITRGGTWEDRFRLLRPAVRGGRPPHYHDNSIGFRLLSMPANPCTKPQ